MLSTLVIIFVIGYAAIVFEHNIKIDKAVPALLIGTLMWSILSIGFHNGDVSLIDGHKHVYSFSEGAANIEIIEEGFLNLLLHHTGKIAEILIFLIGAMAIVDLIDTHRGFEVFKNLITTRNRIKLLWIISIIAFFLSAIIDNLTTTIILISILRKLLPHKDDRIWYVALVITAANAGGAWSPVGDVTTTMLWIGKKLSTFELIKHVFIPSLVCLIVPILIASTYKIFKGEFDDNRINEENSQKELTSSKPMLIVGLIGIAFVPIFKTLTHLPPYIGMMISLSVVWIMAQYFRPRIASTDQELKHFSPEVSLSRIEMTSILFFLGILLGIAAFESFAIGNVGALQWAAEGLNIAIPNQNIVVILLGFLSAVIDNVPLVAASMGMYDYPLDDRLWLFIAYAAGTGGSMLIIGSAAGVAAMGMEKINFVWYTKKITFLTLAGYLAGCAVFLLLS